MELPGVAHQLLIDDPYEERHANEAWEPPVKNLDRFFSGMYQYYVGKGLPAVILQQITAVVSLGFTISFSIFLIAFVDWSNLKHCKDESSCEGNFILKNPFAQASFPFATTIVMYGTLFGAFWIWRVVSAIDKITNAITMEKFYRERLGLWIADLHEMSWNDVVQRLIRLHEHGIHRVAIKDKLTEHDVVLRIMRKDNYMIGMINKKLLDLRVPWWLSPFMSDRLFLTRSLEWSLSFCILEYMFNDQFMISTSFLKDVSLLQTRLRVVGVVHLLLLPFMLLFMTVQFFLQNAQQFHSNKAYLGPRQWSPLALWEFREFNELPHIFDERMNKSYAPAIAYIQSFHNPLVAILARFVAYIMGSFVAILLVISILGESALLYVHIYDHNLLWYLGIFSAAYAGARVLVPDDTKARISTEDVIADVAACTHYFPCHWANRCHTTMVRDEMSELFPFKITVFFMELLSAVLTPMVLCFSLPLSGQQVLDFVRDHTRYVEGVGAVCDYALFDFEEFGDDTYGAPEKGRAEESQRPVDGKMEKSYMNFQQVYPNWRQQPSSHGLPEEGGGRGGNTSGNSPLMEVTSGEVLLDKVRAYRAAKEQQRDLEISQALLESSSTSPSMSLAMTAMTTAFQTNINTRTKQHGTAMALNNSSVGRLLSDHVDSSGTNKVKELIVDDIGDKRLSAIDRAYGDHDDTHTFDDHEEEDEEDDVVDVMSLSSVHNNIHGHAHVAINDHNQINDQIKNHTKGSSSLSERDMIGVDGVGRGGEGVDSNEPCMTGGHPISSSAGISGGSSTEPNNNNHNGKDVPSSSSSPSPPSQSDPLAITPSTKNILTTTPNAEVQGLGTASGPGLGKAQGPGLGPGTWGPQGFTPTSTQSPQPSQKRPSQLQPTQQQSQPHTFYSSSAMDGLTSPKPPTTTRKIFPMGQGGQMFNMGVSTGSASPFAPVETSYYRRLDNGSMTDMTNTSIQGGMGMGTGYHQSQATPNPFNSTRLFQSSRMFHHHHPNPTVGNSKYDEPRSSEYTPMEQRSKHRFHGSLTGGGGASSQLGYSDMPSVLRSILKAENIDYRNDHYWLTKFHHDRMQDPETFDKSLMGMTALGLPSSSLMSPQSRPQPSPQQQSPQQQQLQQLHQQQYPQQQQQPQPHHR